MSDPQPAIYTVICLVVGEDNPFPVEIASDKIVGQLKDMIKEKAQIGVPAHHLSLYHVEIMDDEDLVKNVKEKKFVGALRSTMKLADVFTDPPKGDRVHIIVEPPKSGNSYALGPKLPPSSKLDLVTKTLERITLLPNLAPSSASVKTVTHVFGNLLVYNRPEALTEAIPLALLHEVFGNFLKDCQDHTPTKADNQWFSNLRAEMPKYYDNEAKRVSSFKEIFRTQGVELTAGQAGNSSYNTDGHWCVGHYYPILITEAKNEWDDLKSDPLRQGFLYYVEFARSIALKRDQRMARRLPCLIIYYFGSSIGFAGATVAQKAMLEPLTPLFTLQANAHDSNVAVPITRALGALRRALKSLEEYYTSLKTANPTDSAFTTNPEFPYRDYYTDDGEAVVKFNYLERIDSRKLLFLCSKKSNQQRLCVKFTQKYSKDAHGHCAAHGVAPQLYAVEKLPGGWLMVVMEYLEGDTYTVLTSSTTPPDILKKGITGAVNILHQGEFVHGDIRDVNVMVKIMWDETNNENNVQLVDFDWAGPQGETRYPPNVNYSQIHRPKEARDGEPIIPEHDRAMIDYLFESTVA